jgi:hypothetical protein
MLKKPCLPPFIIYPSKLMCILLIVVDKAVTTLGCRKRNNLIIKVATLT